MASKSGSRKKSGSTLSEDADDKDLLIAELNDRITVLENELRLKQECITFSDITDRKRAEEEIKAAKQQAELYVDLMGHDINNMNQVSLGFLELAHNIIEMNGKLGEDNIVLLEKAMDSLKDSSHLIDSVRKIQREKMGMYEPQVLDVGAVIADAKKHFDRIPGRDIKISYD